MKYSDLLDMNNNGVFNVKDLNNGQFSIGNTIVTLDQLKTIATNAGWVEQYANGYEIIKKTHKYMNALSRGIKNIDLANSIEVVFKNRQSDEYGKTFDLVELYSPYANKFRKMVIIHGMKNNGGNYVIYLDGVSAPKRKCKSLKEVSEFLMTF